MTDRDRIARQLQSADPMLPAVPIAPEAPPGLVVQQGIGSYAWQSKKLLHEEQRLDRVAQVAGAKARAVAIAQIEAGSQAFSDLRSDQSAVVVMRDDDGVERQYTVAFDGTNPTAEADHKLLAEEAARQAEQFRPRPADAGRHTPELMSEAERARRDAAVRHEEERCEHLRYTDTPRGMQLIRICLDCGLEATFGPDGVAYRKK